MAKYIWRKSVPIRDHEDVGKDDMWNIRNGDSRQQIPDFRSDRNIMIVFFQPLLVKIVIWKVRLWTFRSRSRSKLFEMLPFDGKYQPLPKPLLRNFASSHCFRDIHISKFPTLKMYVKAVMYKICSDATRWKMPDFQSDGNSNVCSVTHRLRDIRNSNKVEKVDLEQLRSTWKRIKTGLHSTGNVRIHIGYF